MDSRMMREMVYPNFIVKKTPIGIDTQIQYKFTTFLRKKYEAENEYYLIPVITNCVVDDAADFDKAVKRHLEEAYACLLAYKISYEIIKSKGIYTDSLIYRDTNQQPELLRLGFADEEFYNIERVVNQDFED
jgi:hypothetical protein